MEVKLNPDTGLLELKTETFQDSKELTKLRDRLLRDKSPLLSGYGNDERCLAKFLWIRLDIR